MKSTRRDKTEAEEQKRIKREGHRSERHQTRQELRRFVKHYQVGGAR